MVLTLSDLPAGFRSKSGHYNRNGDQAYIEPGRITGYSATFVGPRDAARPLSGFYSAASTFKTPRAARESLHSLFLGIEKTTAPSAKYKRLPLGARIGNESRLYVFPNGSGHMLAWRYRSVEASVVGTGPAFNRQTVVSLARKQQRRIEAALG
jgi:hypothetical protein